MKTSPHCRLLTNHHVSCFLSLKFWDFVFQSVAFIINCLPPSTPPLLASYTKLFNHTPDYYFLGVIYGLCFHYFNPAMTIKLNFTPSHVIFLATPLTIKAINVSIYALNMSTFLTRYTLKKLPFHFTLPLYLSHHTLLPSLFHRLFSLSRNLLTHHIRNLITSSPNPNSNPHLPQSLTST